MANRSTGLSTQTSMAPSSYRSVTEMIEKRNEGKKPSQDQLATQMIKLIMQKGNSSFPEKSLKNINQTVQDIVTETVAGKVQS